jgi:hypothetical protein
VPSLPEPTDLRAAPAAQAPAADELHPWLARPRMRALLDRWGAHRIRALEREALLALDLRLRRAA